MQLNVNYEEIVFLGMLDRGAFGEVHRARWKGDEVAVKVCVCVCACACVYVKAYCVLECPVQYN